MYHDNSPFFAHCAYGGLPLLDSYIYVTDFYLFHGQTILKMLLVHSAFPVLLTHYGLHGNVHSE